MIKTKLLYADEPNCITSKDGSKFFLIIDKAVELSYFNSTLLLCKKCADDIFIMDNPEKSKSLDIFSEVVDLLLCKNYSKSDYIIAIGGGATLDLGGFCASVFKRGMKLIYIPTTMLSATDSAYGGKNALNYKGYKNQLGSVYFPDYVIIEKDFLIKKLTTESFYDLAEVFKYCFISNLPFEKHLISLYTALSKKENRKRIDEQLANSNNNILTDKEIKKETTFYKSKIDDNIAKEIEWLITNSFNYKMSVVKSDIYDDNIRHILNFGHTFAHMIESASKGEIPHSQAVILGIEYSLQVGVILGVTSPECVEKYSRLCKFFHFNDTYFIDEKDISAIYQDKKITNGKILEPFATEIPNTNSVRIAKKLLPVTLQNVDIEVLVQAIKTLALKKLANAPTDIQLNSIGINLTEDCKPQNLSSNFEFSIDNAQNQNRIKSGAKTILANCITQTAPLDIVLDPSKSITHRYLILGSLLGGTIENISLCDDCLLTLNGLRSLGASITLHGNRAYCIKKPLDTLSPTIQCGDSGSTLRFLLPIALTTHSTATFKGSERLFQRNIHAILTLLDNHSIPYKLTSTSISFSKKLDGKELLIDTETTSQLASGFYLSMLVGDNSNNISFSANTNENLYFKQTVKCVNEYKEAIALSNAVNVPPDCSTFANYYLLSKFIPLKPLDLKLFIGQGEYRALGHIDRLYKIYSGQGQTGLAFIQIDCNDCIDSIPLLASLCAVLGGVTTEFINIEKLANKECDRLSATIDILSAFGAIAHVYDNTLVVKGVKNLVSAILNSHGDHRMTMMSIITAITNKVNIEIDDIANIRKSSLFFIDNMQKIEGFSIKDI